MGGSDATFFVAEVVTLRQSEARFKGRRSAITLGSGDVNLGSIYVAQRTGPRVVGRCDTKRCSRLELINQWVEKKCPDRNLRSGHLFFICVRQSRDQVWSLQDPVQRT